MNTIQVPDTVGQLVARHPALARTFEATGVDYCCGGKKTLAEVCRDKGFSAQGYIALLNQAVSGPAPAEEAFVDAAKMSLTDLADHILETHHAYLRQELPRLDMLTARVANAHGAGDSRLIELRETFLGFAEELSSHMVKEEQILFPMIRQLDAKEPSWTAADVSIANPIQEMEHEHHGAGDALEKMRALTDDYTLPERACNTYRIMLETLAQLERDMHQHVHKEDNVLFPRAAELEAKLAERTNA